MDLANTFDVADTTKTITTITTRTNHFDDVVTVSRINEDGGCVHKIYFCWDGDVFYIAAEEYSLENLHDVVNSINMFKQTNTPIRM